MHGGSFPFLGVDCLHSLDPNWSFSCPNTSILLQDPSGMLNTRVSSDILHVIHRIQISFSCSTVSRETPMMMVSRCFSLSLSLLHQTLSYLLSVIRKKDTLVGRIQICFYTVVHAFAYQFDSHTSHHIPVPYAGVTCSTLCLSVKSCST